MAINKTLEATNKLVAILEPLENADRQRVIHAAFVLLGVTASDAATTTTPAALLLGAKPGPPNGKVASEKAFFDLKQPANKGEELAVAARFREENLDATGSTKDELKAIFKAARRNFDSNNFGRDIDNARKKGIFNRGSGSDAVLSHYGQSYVDTLPDRDAVKALRKPKGAGAKRSPVKRAAKSTAKKAK